MHIQSVALIFCCFTNNSWIWTTKFYTVCVWVYTEPGYHSLIPGFCFFWILQQDLLLIPPGQLSISLGVTIHPIHGWLHSLELTLSLNDLRVPPFLFSPSVCDPLGYLYQGQACWHSFNSVDLCVTQWGPYLGQVGKHKHKSADQANNVFQCYQCWKPEILQ